VGIERGRPISRLENTRKTLIFAEYIQTPTNLVENPGFQTGTLDSWHTTRELNPEDTANWFAADCGRTDFYCAEGMEAEPGNLGRLYQDVTGKTVVGRTYKIGGWIATSNVEGAAVIGLDYVQPNGWTPGPGFLTGSNDWTYFESEEFVLPPMPDDCVALWFLFDFNLGSGYAHWDDVFLIEVS
jgi:hypothetical protein